MRVRALVSWNEAPRSKLLGITELEPWEMPVSEFILHRVTIDQSGTRIADCRRRVGGWWNEGVSLTLTGGPHDDMESMDSA